MRNQTTRTLLAAIQAIIGWEWLMSGVNKVLSGTFPQGLSDFLNAGAKDNPNTWYVALLHHYVMPNCVICGYVVEWTEVVIAAIMLIGAAILLLQPRIPERTQQRFALPYGIAIATSLLIGAFLTVNFHFSMGGWIFPTFDGSSAYGEGVDLDALLPPISLVLLIANVFLVKELTGKAKKDEKSEMAVA